jgi:FkbM family methyltransferase
VNISFLLRFPKLRAKFIHYIKHNHFDELDISIPIQNDYWAKLFWNDSYDSFSEIFIQNEYEGFIPDIEINSVIDLGAHHGFFSVWLQSTLPKRKIKSLLVEPSARCFPVLSELTKRKEYLNNFHFLNKCIGNPQDEENLFFDRPHMAASKYKTEDNEVPLKVSVLMPEDILNWQQPPYDLLKCDIEGAEWDLLNYYNLILENTKFAIIEWHESNKEYDQFIKLINALDFEVTNSSSNCYEEQENDESKVLLIKNKRF